MTGTGGGGHAAPVTPYPEHDGSGTADTEHTRHDAGHGQGVDTSRPAERHERGDRERHDRDRDDRERHDRERHDRDRHDRDRRDLPLGKIKTSAAATFALVFGLSALFCALTGILAPAAVLFGLIGLMLGIAGRKMALRPKVTGRGVATAGLVTAVLGLLLGLAVLGGLAVYVNQQGLDGLQERIDSARDSLPTGADVVDAVPGS